MPATRSSAISMRGSSLVSMIGSLRSPCGRFGWARGVWLTATICYATGESDDWLDPFRSGADQRPDGSFSFAFLFSFNPRAPLGDFIKLQEDDTVSPTVGVFPDRVDPGLQVLNHGGISIPQWECAYFFVHALVILEPA